MTFYTLGHSTHSKEEFLSILEEYNIEILVDVRAYPSSRYLPHFNKDNMEEWLPKDLDYIHFKELGGRRPVNKSVDKKLIEGWENQSFQNYAAYSLTEEYFQAIDRLISLGKDKTLAYMCSEAVPWRCHRLIISNTLVAKGFDVYHIISEGQVKKHSLGLYGAEPVLDEGRVTYPK